MPVLKSHLYILKSSPPQTNTCWSGCREAELIGLEISYSLTLSNLHSNEHHSTMSSDVSMHQNTGNTTRMEEKHFKQTFRLSCCWSSLFQTLNKVFQRAFLPSFSKNLFISLTAPYPLVKYKFLIKILSSTFKPIVLLFVYTRVVVCFVVMATAAAGTPLD